MPQASNLDAFTLDLSADAEQLFLGDSLQLTARAGGSRATTAAVPVTVEIQTPDGRKVPYAMQESAGTAQAAPVYTAGYRADASGMCTAIATATLDGRRIESPAFSFYVKPFTPETSPIPQNVALLQQISRASGGQFCDPAQLDQVLSALDIKSSQEERITFNTRWNTPYILAALMLLLTAEWALRKQRNLA
jgi:hypothetical protein